MQSTSENAAENPQSREGLIDTAVRFLGNPNIIDRPLQQKQTFLKSKGLTDDEIQIAIGRANLSAVAHQQAMVVPGYPIPQHTATPQQLSIWRRITDILHTVALLGGFGYVVFWVYKSYIEPFLFGRPKPKKSTAESLSSIEEAITNVSRCTTELKAEIHSELSRISQERESGAVRNLADIKSDIATVKGLLLSRQQFPSAPTANLFRNSQGSKPMIPAWQMSSEQNSCLKGDDNQAKTLSSSQSEKSQDEFVSCNDQELESDKGKDSSTSTVPMKLDSQSNGSVNTSVESLS